MSFRVPRSHRIFHHITGESSLKRLQFRLLMFALKASITLVASIAYFMMASNLGYAAIPVEFMRSNPKVSGVLREIFYVRYIDWSVTTPVSFTRSFDLASLTAFVASIDRCPPHRRSPMAHHFVHHSHGRNHGHYWTCRCPRRFILQMGILCLCHCRSILHFLQRSSCWPPTRNGGRHWQGLFNLRRLDHVLVVSLSDCLGSLQGGNVISPDSEGVFYGILDILAKPGFGALLLWGHRNIDPRSLGLNFRE